MIEKISIMLRLSKHSVPFFSNLLDARRLGRRPRIHLAPRWRVANEIERWRIFVADAI